MATMKLSPVLHFAHSKMPRSKPALVRLDAGQPHRFASPGAVQDSDLRNAKKWIGLNGKHDAPAWTGRERDTLSHRLLPMMGRRSKKHTLWVPCTPVNIAHFQNNHVCSGQGD